MARLFKCCQVSYITENILCLNYSYHLVKNVYENNKPTETHEKITNIISHISYYLTLKQAVRIVTTDIYKIKSTFYTTPSIKLSKRLHECVVEGCLLLRRLVST